MSCIKNHCAYLYARRWENDGENSFKGFMQEEQKYAALPEKSLSTLY